MENKRLYLWCLGRALPGEAWWHSWVFAGSGQLKEIINDQKWKQALLLLPFCILRFRIKLSTIVLRGVWSVWRNWELLISRYRTVRAQYPFVTDTFPSFAGSCWKTESYPVFSWFSFYLLHCVWWLQALRGSSWWGIVQSYTNEP